MANEIEHSTGSPSPLGLSKTKAGWNIALFSAHAKKVSIGLFRPEKNEPDQIFPLTQSADIWHISLSHIPPDTLYAFRCEGEWNELEGNLFNSSYWLADPYAKALDTSPDWNTPHSLPYRAPFLCPPCFDWEEVAHPNTPKKDLIIYEMHVRGFTVHPSSQVKAPGTFSGMKEKIPYLKELGVTAVELMPIFEFDECGKDPKLPNYWGYNPLSFFSPKRSFAKDLALGGAIQEFKELVQALHKEGIEVILDVVYNHTGEKEDKHYAVSWRGIDNKTYYLIDRMGGYRNFTGCGNTLNTNHPAVRQLILESLRYWVEEMHVDGFRFDLASILTRGLDGHVMEHPPILEAISRDPVLGKVKLIAEAWDAAGLYQLGTFPKWGNWSEWNGRYRDVVRRFIKGTSGKAARFAMVISGSDQIYHGSHTPFSSINFITAHDGYCLRDLVSYQQKHNLANGENNQDGANDNDSWNCGAEGPTSDPGIVALREKQMRNFLLTLFVSQGIPMLLMGDEYGHTRKGNNNPYVQDNEINWFLWDELKKNKDLFHFVRDLIAFRKAHPELRHPTFLTDNDVKWHGAQPYQPNFGPDSYFIAYSIGSLYIAFNASYHEFTLTLPGDNYYLVVNTENSWDKQYFVGSGPLLSPQQTLAPYSALVARH